MTIAGGLDRPELAPLWDELARRYGDGDAPVTVTLRGLSGPQRQAMADLLGAARLPAADIRVRTARLAEALHLDPVGGLRALVEGLRGPLPDRRTERMAARRARERLWEWLAAGAGRLPLFCDEAGRPRLGADDRAVAAGRWVDAVRTAGVPAGDVDAHRRRLTAVLRLLAGLPADGVSLAALAQDTLGDPHGLDRGRSAAAIVLDALAAAFGRPRPSDAEEVRALWEEAGVVPDPLSSTVLVLGLTADGDTPLARWLRSSTAAGEPVVLSLAQLRRWPLPPLPAGAPVYVVENPSLLTEAASRGWARRPPIVCSSGRPTLATVTLLRQLGSDGAELRQHADFDGAGIGITAWLAERAGTTPWRMGLRDYRSATASGGAPPRRALGERIPPTPWEPALREAMADAGVAVYEEELRSGLLTAMAGASPAPPR